MALKLTNNAECLLKALVTNTLTRRYCSRARELSLPEIRAKRNAIFGAEKERQLSLVTRVEKIQVAYQGQPEDCTLIMNKNLSTPFNCAMHLQELLTTRSVVALVDGEPWDMHRPLTQDCTLQFKHFKDEDPYLPNAVLWRSCSFILGYVLENAFQDRYDVELCSFPGPNVRSGSFVYDAKIDVGDWKPTEMELAQMSRLGGQLTYKDLRFERLDVDASIAEKMFADNKFKTAQLPSIAAQSASGHEVTVYRMGDHVDITRGPLIATTWQIARYDVTAMHDIESADFGPLTRVQGLAMPKQLHVHFYVYNHLKERAAKQNSARLPQIFDASSIPKSTKYLESKIEL